MPRIARAIALGYPHHITQRGNYQQAVFSSEDDFIQYKTWLKEYSEKYGLKIWAYCLMSNHVHFVVVPMKEDSLAKTFNTLHMRYSQYFNDKKRTKGHLWQGRFFSCILDEKHLYAAVRYVENNPIRAKIVNSPEEYKWSSARGHMGGNGGIGGNRGGIGGNRDTSQLYDIDNKVQSESGDKKYAGFNGMCPYLPYLPI